MSGDHETIDVTVQPEGCPLCPTCPTDDRGFDIDEDSDYRYAFGCRCCGLQGPRAVDPNPAVELWNLVATSIRLHRLRMDVFSACERSKGFMTRLKKAQDLNGKVIHDGKFVIGHDRALGRVALVMSETMPSIAIDAITAVTLAVGLLEVAAIVDPKATDHFAKLASGGPRNGV